MHLASRARVASWLMIGIGLSLGLYVGSNVGYQVTRQNELAGDWSKQHTGNSTPLAGSLLSLQRPRLAVGQPLAKITVPSINWSGIVLEGTDDSVLAGGPGHLVGTAYPGENDNVVISNHNSYSQQWGDAKTGQTIVLETDYGVYTYRITDFKIVDAGDKAITASTGHATLTFITCYPLWAGALATQRYVVLADLQT